MNTIKRKGFTLVELLVVIAILAILATVSVVGYTAFIERAYVSNDQNIASQLNSYLVAMKNDSNGKYYGKDIDEDNVWELTNDILKDGELDSLVPQSLEYGYRFYFDFNTQQYVVLHEEKDVLKTSGAAEIMRAFANEQNTNKPGKFNYGEKGVFIVDTTGSDLADAVRGFYTYDVDVPVVNPDDYASDEEYEVALLTAISEYQAAVEEKYATLYETAQKVDTAYQLSGQFETLYSNGIITNKYITHKGEQPQNPIKHVGVSDYSNIKLNYKGNRNEETGTPEFTKVDPKEQQAENNVATFAVTEDTTFTFEGTFNVGSGSFNIDVQGEVKVTLEFNVNNTEDVKNLVSAGFAHADVEIIINGEKYTVEDNATLKPENEEKENIQLEYKNPIKSFDITVSDLSSYGQSIIKDGDNWNIAWDVEKFALEAKDFVGVVPTDAVSNYDLKWEVVEAYQDYLTYDDKSGEFSFTNKLPEDGIIIVKATAVHGEAYKEFRIKVGTVAGATIDIANRQFATSSNNNKLTFVYDSGAANNSYDITLKGDVSADDNGNGLQFDSTIVATVDNTSTGLSISNNSTVVLTGSGEGKITVKIGKYLTTTVSYQVVDVSQFTIKPIQNNIFVGSGNELVVSNIFNGTIPAGAELRLYNTPALDDTYMNPKRTLVPVTNANGVTLYVESNTLVGVGMDSTIKFEGSRSEQVYMAFFVDGARVSDDLKVTVVEGLNVTNYDGLVADTTSNKILLKDIAMEIDDSVMTLNNATLYGNGHTIDVTGYNDEGTPQYNSDGTQKTHHLVGLNKDIPISITNEAIITLQGATLRDVNIIGEVYKSSDFYYQDYLNFAYGSSLVKAEAGSVIQNCYLANTRSPLMTTGTVTVENTTLFGGNYANIDVRNNTVLTLKGNVTTINQLIEGVTDETVGLGIAVDIFADYTKTSIKLDGCTLKQYNYVSELETVDENGKDRLAVVTYGMSILGQEEDINVFLSDEIEKFFKDPTYDSYVATKEGVKYFNAGIMFMNGLKITQKTSRLPESDITTSSSGAKTGNGQQVTGLNDYTMASVASIRQKDINVLITTYTIKATANVFAWTPNPATHEVDNVVPENLLPGYFLAD